MEEYTDQPLGPSPSAVSASSVSSIYDSGYMERSAYIAPDKFRGEDGSEISYIVPLPSEITQQIAKLQNAFEIPPRAIRESLFENFWTHCYSWDPIVDRSQVMSMDPEKISPLLLQSIFLAGSRMLSPSQPHVFASPQDYYTRAKTLFWLDYEKDPMNLLIATSLMHWWNPHGPERVSTNTSSFWCRITVSLAQQMGLHSNKKSVPNESLRRRLWWSIVARDRLISVAHGRPQAISLEECDIPRPTLEDFPNATSTGLFFIAYVDLSLIMGRFAQHEIRKSSSKDYITGIEDSLYRWTKNLPEQLRLSSYNANRQIYTSQSFKPYSLECRQLNVLYLATIILLYRSRTLEGPFPTAAVIAASTLAGVFEDFLARDEVRFLGPCFTFHLLAASIALLSCYKYPESWALAQEDLKTLAQAQEEMKKTWPSALGSIGSFDRMYKLTVATQKRVMGTPESTLTPYQAVFFEDCDMSLCRMYTALVRKPERYTGQNQREWYLANGNERNQPMINMTRELSEVVPMPPPHYTNQEEPTGPKPFLGQPPDSDEAMAFDQMFQGETGQLNGAIGDWLFWDRLAFDAS
ncbi:uncharacterized protein A1O5_05017 [Cladophialophora psammophila CBS 110553]|uniref:Xylanolytic transcriptional activator regulatory domain-containing protein n=1 Tax=Cladophialophora psammophila CBS 110553 TaxID=1182543 RepID=W9WWC9_9EURO|nr:uncharacterized protein A1O5_05017 [Cladophialophora psammophila CBS 110553]EXJ72512.1 hypothetical protein A1O5_05017 [Cladophialophora psammophila CBS 110553]